MTPTPEWVAADEDDEARARSSFDRADNTARLALEVADLKRERAALVAEVDRLTSGAHNCLSTKAEAERADAAEAEVRDLRAKVARLESQIETEGCAACGNGMGLCRNCEAEAGGESK